MGIRPFVPRVAAGLLVAVSLGVSGCSSGGQSATGPGNPSGGYDISRIDQLANQFPSDFTVTPIPQTTLTQEQADNFGDMFKKFGMTIDPPQCETTLKTFRAVANTQLQGLAAKGPQDITVIAMQAPQAFPPSGGDNCSHITLSASGIQGTADRIPGPAISGATTLGIKEHVNVTISSNSKTLDMYMYIATFGDKTGVAVTSQSDKGQSDTKLLDGLLVKGVAAVRGK
jgi:hypothetical protein